MNPSLTHCWPVDRDQAVLAGRVWLPGRGPVLVAATPQGLMDLSGLAPTSSALMELSDPAARVRDWLAARVNWDECAHFEQPWNGQQAALDHFRVYSASMLKALGIRIVQGDRPGSIYEAAELHKEIEKANEVAELLELECRFRRAAQVDQEAGDV